MNDYDPKKNCVQFGLMTEEAKGFLKAWPYGWEFYNFQNDRWEEVISNEPSWYKTTVYRGKPAPVVVTTWSPIYSNGRLGFTYCSHEDAVNAANSELLVAILRLDIINGVALTTIEELKK